MHIKSNSWRSTENSHKVIREIGECDKIYYYKDRKITVEDLEKERKMR